MMKQESKRRMNFPRTAELAYLPNTMVGNWLEERLKYKQHHYKHSSIYATDYTSPGYVEETKNLRPDGVDPIVHPKVGSNQHPNFFQNYSTSYDLSYNQYPKWYKNVGHINRVLRPRFPRFEPVDDYIESFHNITGSSLVDYKKNKWCVDSLDPRKTIKSHYEETYLPHQKESYEKTRRATPCMNSSKIYENNRTAARFPLRSNVPFFTSPSSEILVSIPEPPRCNPITWECPKKTWKRCMT